jgi:hypothetical protein
MTSGNLVSCNGVSANCSGSAQGVGNNGDYFITKYNSSGTWQWTVQLGETGVGLWVYLSVAPMGDVIIGGYTTGNLVSCNGVSANCTGSSQGGVSHPDTFVSKYNSSGVFQWTAQLGETGASTDGYGVSGDSSGNVYISGLTTGNLLSCKGVSANCSGSSQGGGTNTDYFVIKYNASGAWQWTQQLGETGANVGQAMISADLFGNVNIGGWTTGNLVSCGGLSSNCSGSSQGVSDYFVSQYGPNGIFH